MKVKRKRNPEKELQQMKAIKNRIDSVGLVIHLFGVAVGLIFVCGLTLEMFTNLLIPLVIANIQQFPILIPIGIGIAVFIFATAWYMQLETKIKELGKAVGKDGNND